MKLIGNKKPLAILADEGALNVSTTSNKREFV